MTKKQGLRFLKNRQKIKKKSIYQIIDNDYKEAYENINNVNDKVSELEELFNTKLNNYENLYKQYLEELKKHKSSFNNNYKEKIVKVGDTKYYITKHGVYRKFSEYAWANKDIGCPVEMVSINRTELDKLKEGAPMHKNEYCRSGGINIENDDGDVSWLDIYGRRHKYDNFLFKHKSCNNNKYSHSNEKYNAYEDSGRTWGENDKCEIIDFNSDKTQKLILLNNELFNILKQIKIEINKLNINNKKTSNFISKGKLIKVKNKLDKERKILSNMTELNNNSNATIEDNINKINTLKLYYNLAAGSCIVLTFYLLTKIL